MYNWCTDTKNNQLFFPPKKQNILFKLAFKSILLSSADEAFVLINSFYGFAWGKYEIMLQLIQTYPVTQNSGIPPHSMLLHTEKQKSGIRSFSINFSWTDLLKFRQRDAKTFLLKHKAQSELLTGGHIILMARRGSEPLLWGCQWYWWTLQHDPASEGVVKGP